MHLDLYLPPDLEADTGLDALTHAIESYVSQWHNDFSDALAIGAIQIIFKFLLRSYKIESALKHNLDFGVIEEAIDRTQEEPKLVYKISDYEYTFLDGILKNLGWLEEKITI